MNINCYQNFSKKPNSTATPSGTGTQHSCVFKDDCSIVNPVFVLDGIDLTVNYVQFNGRYYFVRDIVLQNKNIYELHCEIDVLATWKSAIGSSTQYVLRSADEYDGSIVDMFYPTKKEATVMMNDPVSAPSWATSIDSGWYVVGIISGSNSTALSGSISQGCVQYYAFTPAQFNAFTQSLFTESNWTAMQSSDKYSFNPIQYISSVMWFPVAPPHTSSALSTLKIGWENIPCACYGITDPIDSANYNFVIDHHPQAATRGSYLDSAPFSEYKLTFPPFGDVELDGLIAHKTASVNHYIMASIQIDFVSGRAMLIVRITTSINPTTYYEVTRREVGFGVRIQIAQIAADRLGAAVQAFGGTIGGIAGIITGDVVGGITSAASGIISGIRTVQPRVASAGTNDSMLSLISRTYTPPKLYEIFYEVVDEDNTNHGRPLCQSRQISDLPGYILCANSEVSIPGTMEEKERIRAFMDAGFFYE